MMKRKIFLIFVFMIILTSLLVIAASKSELGSTSICSSATQCEEIDEVWNNIEHLIRDRTDEVWVPTSQYAGSWVSFETVYPPLEEESAVATCDGCETVEGAYVTASGIQLNTDALLALNRAAVKFHNETGLNLAVSSGYRTMADQAELYYNNCIKYSKGMGSSSITCGVDTYDGGIEDNRFNINMNFNEVITVFESYGIVPASGHLAGNTMDLWPAGEGNNFHANNTLMAKMQDFLIGEDFCRISNESWHYEYKRSDCSIKKGEYTFITGGNTYDPFCVGDDKIFDYAPNDGFDSSCAKIVCVSIINETINKSKDECESITY